MYLFFISLKNGRNGVSGSGHKKRLVSTYTLMSEISVVTGYILKCSEPGKSLLLLWTKIFSLIL